MIAWDVPSPGDRIGDFLPFRAYSVGKQKRPRKSGANTKDSPTGKSIVCQSRFYPSFSFALLTLFSFACRWSSKIYLLPFLFGYAKDQSFIATSSDYLQPSIQVQAYGGTSYTNNRAGYRENTGVLYQILGLSSNRNFWSSTENSSNNAYNLNVNSTNSNSSNNNNKSNSNYILCYK